jgi:uncharacterized protein
MLAMDGALLTLIIAILAVHFGYAAQRGTLCAVYAVNQLLKGEPPEMLLAFFRASLWVALVSWPLLWLLPAPHVAQNLRPDIVMLGGALMFGIGAAINGGCSFATILKIAEGDVAFMLTLVGLFVGAAAVHMLFAPEPSVVGASLVARPGLVILMLWALLLIWAGREVLRLWRIRSRDWVRGSWPPALSATVMGLSGGMLYVIEGSWMYTVALDKGLTLMAQGAVTLGWILLCVLVGATWSAWRRHKFHLRFSGPDAAAHLAGGLLMGAGGATGVGGNDTLVLYAMPSLSYHAVPSYLVMLAGIALALKARHWLARR